MKASFLIAQVTFKELVREKTLHGLLVVFLLISLFSLVLGQLSFAEQVRLSMDFGLSVMHLCLVGLSILLGSQLIYREVERKTIFTLLVKPINRYEYIFGKYLGLIGLLFFVACLCALFLLVTTRYFGEFYFRTILTTSFGQWLEASFLVSVMLLLGQKLKPAVSVFCGLALFLIGHWFETLQFLTKSEEGGLFVLYKVLSSLFPNLEGWNWKSRLVYENYINFSDLAFAFLSAVLWSFVYLLVTAFFFERRDLAS